jgi:AmmeMemoRadiSam system protein B
MEANGHRTIFLRDPMNISQNIVGLPGQTLFIVSLMDGTRSFKEIQEEFLRRRGRILPTDDLEQLIDGLDKSLMLDSRHFREELLRLEREYLDAPLRAPRHRGGGYRTEGDELAAMLEGYFEADGGPGDALRRAPADRRLKAIVAPHIDFDRGGPSYAWAYAEIARDPADLYVVLGTSHVPLSQYFSVTRKDFGTPFGPVKTDTGFLDLLEETSGMKLESDPLVHRSEHSVELQTVWLRHLLGDRARIVPILCGSLHRMIEEGTSPLSAGEVSRFIEGLREAIARCGQRVVLIAGADLAHLGTGFGDEQVPDDARLEEVEKADLESMEAAVRRDAEGFFQGIQAERDARRICGLSPIYATVHALAPSEGRLLNYKQCIDPNGFRTVTIASAAWFE